MTSSAIIDLHSTVKRSPQLVSSDVDDDIIILSIENGRYYGTQTVGKRIWTIISDAVSVDDICATLLREFDVSREVCETEVLAFLRQLHQEGLLQVL